MLYTIQNHLDYNRWANVKIADALREVDEVLLHQEIKSSFPSIAKTVLHIWDAETIWLKRFQGESIREFPSKNFKGNTQEMLDGFTQSAVTLINFIDSKGEAFLKSNLKYVTTRGDAFEDVVESLLYHIVNHGAYHRGQITTMMREAGITKVPGTDIILYLRANS